MKTFFPQWVAFNQILYIIACDWPQQAATEDLLQKLSWLFFFFFWKRLNLSSFFFSYEYFPNAQFMHCWVHIWTVLYQFPTPTLSYQRFSSWRDSTIKIKNIWTYSYDKKCFWLIEAYFVTRSLRASYQQSQTIRLGLWKRVKKLEPVSMEMLRVFFKQWEAKGGLL